jgi:valyl-tRNA synthetase
MHPLMPFITEELWQRIPRPRSRRATIAFGPFPTPEPAEAGERDPEVDAWMALLQGVVSSARSVRSEHNVDKKADVPMRIRSASPDALAFLRSHAASIRFLVKTSGEPMFEAPGGAREAGTTVGVVPSEHGPIEVLVALKGLVAPDEEKARIERELRKIDKDLATIDKKLGAPGFVDRAPPDVVEETKTLRRSLVEAKARLEVGRSLADEL